MNRKLDLSRLRELRNESPTTLMGMVRMAWPEIRAALDRGHTLKLVHARLNEAGVPISYRRLSLYLGRIRREGMQELPSVRTTKTGRNTEPLPTSAPEPATSTKPDPAANIRDRLVQNRAGFNFELGPPDEDSLI